jgi:hypothetical protein
MSKHVTHVLPLGFKGIGVEKKKREVREQPTWEIHSILNAMEFNDVCNDYA